MAQQINLRYFEDAEHDYSNKMDFVIKFDEHKINMK